MPQFFSFPLNYNQTTPDVAADNNYDTGTTGTVTCDITDSSGASQTFTHVFLKGHFTDDISMHLDTSGGGVGIIHNPKLTDDSGDDTILDLDGYDNILYPLEGAATEETVRFETQTASDEIVEVMILNELLSISDNDRYSVQFDEVPLFTQRTAINGAVNTISALGNTRDKNLIRYNLYFNRAELPELYSLKRIIRNHKQFVFAAEYNRFPEMVFPASIQPEPRLRRYRVRPKEVGQSYGFSVREI